jgi:hypothetical protein
MQENEFLLTLLDFSSNVFIENDSTIDKSRSLSFILAPLDFCVTSPAQLLNSRRFYLLWRVSVP